MPLIDHKPHYKPILKREHFQVLISEINNLDEKKQGAGIERFEKAEYKDQVLTRISHDISTKKLQYVFIDLNTGKTFLELIKELLRSVDKHQIEDIYRTFKSLSELQAPYRQLGEALKIAIDREFKEYVSAKESISSKSQLKVQKIEALKQAMIIRLNQQLLDGINLCLKPYNDDKDMLTKVKESPIFKRSVEKIGLNFHVEVEQFLELNVNESTPMFADLRAIMKAHQQNIEAINGLRKVDDLIAMMANIPEVKQQKPKEKELEYKIYLPHPAPAALSEPEDEGLKLAIALSLAEVKEQKPKEPDYIVHFPAPAPAASASSSPKDQKLESSDGKKEAAADVPLSPKAEDKELELAIALSLAEAEKPKSKNSVSSLFTAPPRKEQIIELLDDKKEAVVLKRIPTSKELIQLQESLDEQRRICNEIIRYLSKKQDNRPIEMDLWLTFDPVYQLAKKLAKFSEILAQADQIIEAAPQLRTTRDNFEAEFFALQRHLLERRSLPSEYIDGFIRYNYHDVKQWQKDIQTLVQTIFGLGQPIPTPAEQKNAQRKINSMYRVVVKLVANIQHVPHPKKELFDSVATLRVLQGMEVLLKPHIKELQQPAAGSRKFSIFSSSEKPKLPPPDELKCSLTKQIMTEPVTLETGETYEKKAIIEWIQKNGTCPKTEQKIAFDPVAKQPRTIVPNYALIGAINAYNESKDGVSKLNDPDFWLCPIAQETMKDPVILATGHTFDRIQILDYCNQNPGKPVECPISKDLIELDERVPRVPVVMIPNKALASLIERFGEKEAPNFAL